MKGRGFFPTVLMSQPMSVPADRGTEGRGGGPRRGWSRVDSETAAPCQDEREPWFEDTVWPVFSRAEGEFTVS